MPATHCSTLAVSAFHDCGRASEEEDVVDTGGALEEFRTDIEVDIVPVAVEAVAVEEVAAGAVAAEAVAAVGYRYMKAWPPLAATVGGHAATESPAAAPP
jgi:hypothetical protein